MRAERPAARKLEAKLVELIPYKHSIVTGFSRNALFLVLKALGWEKPAEIIIPAFTCPVVKCAIDEANVVPVPVDAEEGGYNIDPDLVEKAITPNTKAVYVVHTYGHPAQIEKICAVARKHNLIVIEDLAHSLFTINRDGKQLGTYGDFAILSFTKEIVNFEGGAVLTNNTKIYRKMLRLRDRYQQKESFSIASLIDKYVRLVGSWWESRFSLPALLLMKLNDLVNALLYKGNYRLNLDYSKFYASELSCRLTLMQLEGLYKKKSLMREHHIESPYHIGFTEPGMSLSNLLSFRTWHSYLSSPYPRADALYKHLRIYSRLLSRTAGNKNPVEAPGVYQVQSKTLPIVEREEMRSMEVSITAPENFVLEHEGFNYYAVDLSIDHSLIRNIIAACEAVERDTWVAQEDFFEYIKKSDLLVYAEKDGQIVGFNLVSIMYFKEYCIYTIDEAMVLRKFQGNKIARNVVVIALWWFMKKGRLDRSIKRFVLVSTSANPKVVNNYFKNKYVVNILDNSFYPSKELIEVQEAYARHYNYELVDSRYPFCFKKMFPGSNQFEKYPVIPKFADEVRKRMPPDFDYVKRGDAWAFMVHASIPTYKFFTVSCLLAFIGPKVLLNKKLGLLRSGKKGFEGQVWGIPDNSVLNSPVPAAKINLKNYSGARTA